MPFEETLYLVMAADGMKIEALGVDAFKNEAGFQPFAALVESVAEITDAESPVMVRHAELIANPLDDLPQRFPLHRRERAEGIEKIGVEISRERWVRL